MSSASITPEAPRAAAEAMKKHAHKKGGEKGKSAHEHVAAEAGQAAPAVASRQVGVHERRGAERAMVSMLVQVVSADRVATYLAENLSASGALLSDGPELPLGAELSLALKLRGDTWHVRAKVVRVQRDPEGRVAIGVAFPSIVPKVQDLIQNHVLSCLRRNARNDA